MLPYYYMVHGYNYMYEYPKLVVLKYILIIYNATMLLYIAQV